jgi:Acyl-CoA carboxylase epsilon subunit
MTGRSAPPAEHVAAITAAIAALHAEQRDEAGDPVHPEHLSMWVEASRRSAQRASLQRGPWRLSGRLGRRFRT